MLLLRPLTNPPAMSVRDSQGDGTDASFDPQAFEEVELGNPSPSHALKEWHGGTC